jgi:hypothetical protein
MNKILRIAFIYGFHYVWNIALGANVLDLDPNKDPLKPLPKPRPNPKPGPILVPPRSYHESLRKVMLGDSSSFMHFGHRLG